VGYGEEIHGGTWELLGSGQPIFWSLLNIQQLETPVVVDICVISVQKTPMKGDKLREAETAVMLCSLPCLLPTKKANQTPGPKQH
jgi:hypothetical protein